MDPSLPLTQRSSYNQPSVSPLPSKDSLTVIAAPAFSNADTLTGEIVGEYRVLKYSLGGLFGPSSASISDAKSLSFMSVNELSVSMLVEE